MSWNTIHTLIIGIIFGGAIFAVSGDTNVLFGFFLGIGIMSILMVSNLMVIQPKREGFCTRVPECNYDNARTIEMPDGSPGVCVLNGMACSSFMKYK